jgi:hypothetical protein
MDAFTTLGNIPEKVEGLRELYRQRDARAAQVQAVRRGDFEQVAPDLFNDDWPRPIVANLIDTSARDMAAMLAPLPKFSCSSSLMLAERAKKFADKRTKIANHYIDESDLQTNMQMGADQFNTYGMLTLQVEPCFDRRLPIIHVKDSFNTYPVWDRHGNTTAVARVFFRTLAQLRAEYSEAGNLADHGGIKNDQLEVIEYVDDKVMVVYVPKLRNLVLERMANPVGKCTYVCIKKPSLDSEIRGTYDDVIWVQLARHRMQMLAMEAADKSVRAPLVVPPDVGDIPLGPDAVIHTQQGAQSVGRARLDVPQAAFAGIDQLRQEMQVGAMSPEARSGNIDASVITGQGVQALMAGFSSQIDSAQKAFIGAFKRALAICFQMDEKLWGEREKTIRGSDAGNPFELKYKAKRDINGDYSVDVQYGALAGLDPNRALVFVLQAQAAGLVSKEWAARQLPAGLNVAEEQKRLEIEAMRSGILNSVSALAQSIPQLVANGQDPSSVVHLVAMVTQGLQKGDPLEDIVAKVFAPQPPPAPPQGGVDPATGAPAGGVPGFQDSGLPAGLQPGLATEGPQGRPDIQQFFASMGSNGQANLSGGVSRMAPAV